MFDFSFRIFGKKNNSITNFMKIRPVGAEFVSRGHTDGWMDIMTLIVAFRNFANAPKFDRGSTLSPQHAQTPCTRITAPWQFSTSGQQQRTLHEGRPAVVSCRVTQLCGRQAAARGTFREIFIKGNCLVFFCLLTYRD